MSNRLAFFRKQMAAFEGAANPQRAIDSKYYVPEPQHSVSDLITRRVALRPSSTHLLIGGIGSGKTTQLLVTCERINREVEDIHACYVDVSLHTDLSQISSGVLMAIAGVVLSDLTKDSNDSNIKECHGFIDDYAYGSSEPVLTLPMVSLFRPSKGVLSPVSEDSLKKKKLLQAISQVNKIARKKYGNIILLFDGLDRFDNIKAFVEIVTFDLQKISDAEIGVVLVSPLRALYDDQYRDVLEQAVNYFDYRSFFDVENHQESRTFFETILKNRADEGFIEESAIQSLIDYSGGVLRDLINLTQVAIEEAYLSDSDRLEQAHVENAVYSFGRAKLLGFSDSQARYILKQESINPTEGFERQFILNGCILQYTYPKKRYVLHPAIKQFISYTYKEDSSDETEF